MIKLPKLHLWQLSPIVVSVALFPLVWLQLSDEWLSGEQDLAHGFPALLAYFFVLVNRPITTHRNTPAMNGLISLALLALLLFYGVAELVNIDVFTYAALFAALPCLIALSFGWRASLSLWHLHLFFILPLPLWDGLLETLVNIASIVCSNFMRLFNLPMLIEGNSITIPTGRVLIAEGCSGIRYFLVSIILGYLLAHLNGHTGWRLILTVLCGALLGLLANWVRIILLIFIGYYSEMQSSLMQDHETFGWIVFAAFCIPALYFAPQRQPGTPAEPHYAHPTIPQGLTWLVIGGLTTALIVWLRTPPISDPNLATSQLANWQLTTSSIPAGIAAPTVAYDTLQHNSSDTRLTLVRHQRQTEDDKLVPFFVQSRVGDRWFRESTGQLTATLVTSTTAEPTTLTLNTEVFKSLLGNTRYLSVQVFQVGDAFTGSYTRAKLLQMPALLQRSNSFSYYLLQTPCKTEQCDTATETLKKALTELHP